MKFLYFVRHAESVANSKNLLAGQLDYPLTAKGMNDATLIAEKFSQVTTIDLIYSSSLKRAQHTAELFARELGISEIRLSDKIVEQNAGKYSGMSYEDLKSEQDYEHDRTNRWNWIPENGESYRMIAERVKTYFSETIDTLPEASRTLIVTHAVTMRLIRAYLENTLPAYPTAIAKNGEIWKVQYTGPSIRHNIKSIVFNETKKAL